MGIAQLSERRAFAVSSAPIAAVLLVVVPALGVCLSATTASATGAGKLTVYPGISGPDGIVPGPDGALWFTNFANNSIGRITTAGVVTSYTGTGILHPLEIAAGPDGALWFTNFSDNTIGRITTAGAVTNFTDASINDPYGITAGPDGALWFTNFSNNSIGRITHRRRGHQLHRRHDQGAGRDRGRSRRCVVVHQPGRRLDRTDHHRGCRHQLHRTEHRHPTGITAGPDGALWFTNQTGSVDRADHDRGSGDQLRRPEHQSSDGDHGRSRRRAVVHEPRQQHRSGGSPPPVP